VGWEGILPPRLWLSLRSSETDYSVMYRDNLIVFAPACRLTILFLVVACWQLAQLMHPVAQLQMKCRCTKNTSCGLCCSACDIPSPSLRCQTSVNALVGRPTWLLECLIGAKNVECHGLLQIQSVFHHNTTQFDFFIGTAIMLYPYSYTTQVNNFWSHGEIFILIRLIQVRNCPVFLGSFKRVFSKPENPH